MNFLKHLDELIAYCETGEPRIRVDDVKMLLEEMKSVVEAEKADTLEFEEIANHLQDGIYISDGTGNTLFINKAYTRITGITPEMVLGKNVKEISDKYMLYKNAVTLKVIQEKKRVDSIGESLINNQKMLITG
ncbi:MAG: hypothetical protein PWQ12_2075, partial [Clostridiales bacterium]|nr:hypothetical protein [Clostridiales bacterium]